MRKRFLKTQSPDRNPAGISRTDSELLSIRLALGLMITNLQALRDLGWPEKAAPDDKDWPPDRDPLDPWRRVGGTHSDAELCLWGLRLISSVHRPLPQTPPALGHVWSRGQGGVTCLGLCLRNLCSSEKDRQMPVKIEHQMVQEMTRRWSQESRSGCGRREDEKGKGSGRAPWKWPKGGAWSMSRS